MKLIPVPLAYLKEGDRFVAMRDSKYNAGEIHSGVASMDGHMVSDTYGYRVNNHYHADRIKNYINVHFDGVGYFAPGFGKPNDTIYERDNWVVYVTPSINNRIEADIKANVNWVATRAGRLLEAQKAGLLAQVAVLQKQIEDLTFD